VFKGVEILQLSITGHAATGWKGISGRVIGIGAVVASIVAASTFWRFIDAQAQSVANK
jgi:peptidoglycan/LPS O-acetylase OafA/YrhL